jgi:uncharacterized protein
MPTPEDIDRVAKVIADEFRPQKIILFGSRAYGIPRPDSDADILVILPFECSPYRMTVNMLKAIGDSRGFDIVPRRPEFVEQWYKDGDPMMRDAIDRGVVLYEAAA